MLKFLRISRRLLPIKTHYGLFNAGTSTTQPTMPVYGKVLKFSSFIVGLIYTILPLLGLIIKPLFGGIADKYKKHKAVLIGWEIVVLAAYFGIQFIPAPDVPTTAKTHSAQSVMACSYSNAAPNFLIESNNCTWTCQMTENRCKEWEITSYCSHLKNDYIGDTCNTMSFNISRKANFSDCTSDCSNGVIFFDEDSTEDDDTLSNDLTFQQWQFWVFLVLLVGAWAGTAVVTTLSDTICIEICEDPHIYGKQRMWGTLSWGVVVVINGYIIDAVSNPGEEKNYTPAFYIMLAFLLIDVVVSYYLEINFPEQSESIGKDAWKMMMQPRTIHMSIGCIFMGISLGLVWNFLFWLLEDLADAMGDDTTAQIKTIEGVVSAAQCFIGEGPSFFFGGWIVNKIGYNRSMSLIFLLIGIRFILYSILVNPWLCIPIEFFQGNFGLFYSTMTCYAREVALPGTEATIQSILCALCEGVGVAIGSFVAGLLYDGYGGSFTFQMFGIVFLALFVVNEIVGFIFTTIDKRAKKEAENNEQIRSS